MTTENQKSGSSLSLWLWVAAGFVFLASLWTVMFVFAGKANVQSVPVESRRAEL